MLRHLNKQTTKKKLFDRNSPKPWLNFLQSYLLVDWREFFLLKKGIQEFYNSFRRISLETKALIVLYTFEVLYRTWSVFINYSLKKQRILYGCKMHTSHFALSCLLTTNQIIDDSESTNWIQLCKVFTRNQIELLWTIAEIKKNINHKLKVVDGSGTGKNAPLKLAYIGMGKNCASPKLRCC